MTNLSLASLSNELADLSAAHAPSVVQVLGARRPASGVIHGPDTIITNARPCAKTDCTSASTMPIPLKPISPAGIRRQA
jgi:hypothetical protein